MTTQRSRFARFGRERPRLGVVDSSAPVGLPGELMMMPRVRGVTAASSASARSVNPSSSRVRTTTGVAPASFDLLDQRRPAGRVRDDFVARSEERQRRVMQRLLAAGRDDHLVGCVADAVIVRYRAATASRSSVMPGLAVYFVKLASSAACAAAVMCARRRKVRLPRAEIHDVHALAAQAFRLDRAFHRRRQCRCAACGPRDGECRCSCVGVWWRPSRRLASRDSTTGGTSPASDPPSAAMSLTRVELT